MWRRRTMPADSLMLIPASYGNFSWSSPISLKTYNEFRQVIYALYPGSEEERKWSVADIDKLVGEQLRLGVLLLGDLGEYHRQFLAITTFLIEKMQLSTAEQSRAFARGFQAELWSCILQRLQLKLPNHFPDDPYPLA